MSRPAPDALLASARDDENVVGVVIFGSRGKGAYVTTASDCDVFVVVREAETVARQHGLGGVVDGWEPDLAWLRSGAQ